MPRTILAYNGDLESSLALHWLVHERGYDVITLSINLGQEASLEALGERALDLGANSAQVIDRREMFLHDFALPVLQADAVYQQSCFLGSALARYLIAQEIVRVAQEEGCDTVAHGSSSKGNDQVRLETAIAALGPHLLVAAPVREWNLKTMQDKLNYVRRRGLPIEEPKVGPVAIDRNLWGVSVYLPELDDAWKETPAEAFILSRPGAVAAEPTVITLGFEAGVPCQLDGSPITLLKLARELNRLGTAHGIGRSDVIEDRMFGIKSREFYEAPVPTILMAAHRDLQSLVHSREIIQLRGLISPRYAELVYRGLWFHDARRSLQSFFSETQKLVTGDVRLKLHQGSVCVLARRSPHSLYDGRLANQSNLELFDSQWAKGFTSLWTLGSRLAGTRGEGEGRGAR